MYFIGQEYLTSTEHSVSSFNFLKFRILIKYLSSIKIETIDISTNDKTRQGFHVFNLFYTPNKSFYKSRYKYLK
jgi:hypothetical protein